MFSFEEQRLFRFFVRQTDYKNPNTKVTTTDYPHGMKVHFMHLHFRDNAIHIIWQYYTKYYGGYTIDILSKHWDIVTIFNRWHKNSYKRFGICTGSYSDKDDFEMHISSESPYADLMPDRVLIKLCQESNISDDFRFFVVYNKTLYIPRVKRDEKIFFRWVMRHWDKEATYELNDSDEIKDAIIIKTRNIHDLAREFMELQKSQPKPISNNRIKACVNKWKKIGIIVWRTYENNSPHTTFCMNNDFYKNPSRKYFYIFPKKIHTELINHYKDTE